MLWLRMSDVEMLGAHVAFVGSTLIDVKILIFEIKNTLHKR